MCEKLYNLIISSKNNNCSCLEVLLERFDKLIIKYARLLDYEDAKQDLILHFIKTVKSMKINDSMDSDPILVSYLHKTIKNEYIRLSKAKTKYSFSELNLDIITDSQELEIDYFSELFDKYLTKKESDILTLLFKKGYTVTEVSKLIDISRQAVNQCKNRSLIKLRKNLIDCM